MWCTQVNKYTYIIVLQHRFDFISFQGEPECECTEYKETIKMR